MGKGKVIVLSKSVVFECEKNTLYGIWAKNAHVKYDIKIDSVKVERVKCTSFLGIQIYEKLNCKEHIIYTIKVHNNLNV